MAILFKRFLNVKFVVQKMAQINIHFPQEKIKKYLTFSTESRK